jgi:hypothetical protein
MVLAAKFFVYDVKPEVMDKGLKCPGVRGQWPKVPTCPAAVAECSRSLSVS